MRIATVFAGALALSVSLAGCGRLDSLASGDSAGSSAGSASSVPFSGNGLRGRLSVVDGVRFRSRITALSEDRRGFTAETRGATRNLALALEAGRLEAVRYCLTTFGGSDIDWTLSPDRPATEVRLSDRGSVVLAGRCVTR